MKPIRLPAGMPFRIGVDVPATGSSSVSVTIPGPDPIKRIRVDLGVGCQLIGCDDEDSRWVYDAWVLDTFMKIRICLPCAHKFRLRRHQVYIPRDGIQDSAVGQASRWVHFHVVELAKSPSLRYLLQVAKVRK